MIQYGTVTIVMIDLMNASMDLVYVEPKAHLALNFGRDCRALELQDLSR